jgi:hypothetical protein
VIHWLFSGHGQAVVSAAALIAVAGLFLSRFGSPVRWVAVVIAAVLLLRGLPVDGYYHTYLLLGGSLGVLGLKYYHNEALGFEEPFPLLLASTLLLAFFLVMLYRRLERTEFRLALTTEIGGALVLGGLLGILLDRVRLGYVVDYILIGRLIYNLADMMTILGLATLTARLVEVMVQAHARGANLQDLLTVPPPPENRITVIARNRETRLSPWVLVGLMLVLGAGVLGGIWRLGGKAMVASISRAEARADAER